MALIMSQLCLPGLSIGHQIDNRFLDAAPVQPCPWYAPPVLCALDRIILPSVTDHPFSTLSLCSYSSLRLGPHSTPHPITGSPTTVSLCNAHPYSMKLFLIPQKGIIFQTLLAYGTQLMMYHILSHEAASLSLPVLVIVMTYYWVPL